MGSDLPGDRFGRYRLVELIGKGGMAEVFRATSAAETDPNAPGFVIKRIRPDRTDSPKFVQMFCDEARISALLHHPNIVEIYDFGQIDGAYFMAMEYLEGKDLGEVFRALRAGRAALPPPLGAKIARDVARALEHAHGAAWADGEPGGIVHRDISPSNVMLCRNGGIKILDFGIAKAAALARPVDHADDGSGGHPKLQGHLGYLSPEQIRGTEVDRRSDLFSLGVVLWEMLTGQRLFAGKDEFETMSNVLLRPVPALSRAGTRVPLALARIVGRALDRDPNARYQSAGAMAGELDLFLGGEPCPDDAVGALLGRLYGADRAGASEPRPAGAAPAPPRARRPVRAVAAFVAGATAALALGALWIARASVPPGRGADQRSADQSSSRAADQRSADQSSSARSVSTSR
jgi:serine/threonine-protein kinase